MDSIAFRSPKLFLFKFNCMLLKIAILIFHFFLHIKLVVVVLSALKRIKQKISY